MKITRCMALCFLFAVVPGLSALTGQDLEARKPEDDFLAALRKEHPRLILTDERLAALKTDVETDKTLQRCARQAMAEADKALTRTPLVYRKIGPRLLHVSRDCLQRVYALALAWRWTGERKYAEAARECLLAVCGFKDWNPSHFLDTAEMSHAVGLGYDWLHAFLDESEKDTIREGLIRNGMKPGLKAYTGKGAWWVHSAFNWNQVCNSGLLVGALSIADTHPEYAQVMIPSARDSLPRALNTYKPDGAWPEGPGYWNYATSYTVFGLAAMESALGTDFGLSKNEGLEAAGGFPLYCSGPGETLFLNFADCGERSRRRTLPCLFWLAEKYDQPFLADREHEKLIQRGAGPLHLIWYMPRPDGASITAPALDRLFRGPVEVAVFRSAWDEENALFLGVKAGYNQVNHGHLDLGNFELDALGVRWFRDLGADDYNLPGYWDGKPGGKRWDYYRLRSSSHNVPQLNHEDQDPLGKAKITRFESRPEEGFAIVDLSSAYGKWARRVTRGVALVKRRCAVLVQDEFELKETCDVTFGLTTDGLIDTSAKEGALLTLDGKRLLARILSPEGARFTVGSAEQGPPEKTNKGVRRLEIRLDNRQGNVMVSVLLVPIEEESDIAITMECKSLADW